MYFTGLYLPPSGGGVMSYLQKEPTTTQKPVQPSKWSKLWKKALVKPYLDLKKEVHSLFPIKHFKKVMKHKILKFDHPLDFSSGYLQGVKDYASNIISIPNEDTAAINTFFSSVWYKAVAKVSYSVQSLKEEVTNMIPDFIVNLPNYLESFEQYLLE